MASKDLKKRYIYIYNMSSQLYALNIWMILDVFLNHLQKSGVGDGYNESLKKLMTKIKVK